MRGRTSVVGIVILRVLIVPALEGMKTEVGDLQNEATVDDTVRAL